MWLKSWPTRYGSLASSDEPNPDDDPAVAHLRAVGCVFTGKVTMPEFGNFDVTDSPLTGLAVNPWDTGRSPGACAAK